MGNEIHIQSRQDDGRLDVQVQGRLDAQTLPDAWSQLIPEIQRLQPQRLVVHLDQLTSCKGAGLGLFVELRRLMALRGGEAEFHGASTELATLMKMSQLRDPQASELEMPPAPSLVNRVGRATAGFFGEMGDLVSFVGELTAALAWAARHPRSVRYRDLWVLAEKTGVNALGVILLLGALVGLIMAFQTAIPLQRYGAVTLIPSIVGISMTRELGPLITAIILAGRSGSAFAAEIGTMKVTEEINALETFGLHPLRILVVPRAVAAVLVVPLLTLFNIAAGLAAGYVVMANYGYSFTFYTNALKEAVELGDLLGGVGKTLAFGLIVAAIGCMRGLRTQSGPGAVGDSTTRSVVSGIILVIFADMLFGVAYFYLGI